MTPEQTEIATLRAENEALRKQRDDLDMARIDQQVRLKFLAERLGEFKAVRLLMEHEWVLDARECLSYCLHCNALERAGHAEDCEGFGLRGVVPPDLKALIERDR